MIRSTIILLVLLAGIGCKRKPACFQPPEPSRPKPNIPDEVYKVYFEPFVFVDPPDDFETLIKETDQYCGKIKLPSTPSSDIHRMVFKETRDTPRDIALETSKQTSITMHQDDIILEVYSSHGLDGIYLNYWFVKDGNIVKTKRIRIADATKSPQSQDNHAAPTNHQPATD